MKLRKLNEAGQTLYKDWLAVRQAGESPPEALTADSEYSVPYLNIDIDPQLLFATRFEFGRYLANALDSQNARELLHRRNDGFWDWISVVYFSQLGKKTSKYWHYAVTRSGHSGSLAYRHLARTAFEMYWRHGEASLVMLNVGMDTWGDLAEQLTSRQNVAYHRGYILTANNLYMSAGRLIRGAAGRVKPKKKRKPGDTSGRGGVARLALAVRRLCRTYDTHVLSTAQMVALLPKEFQSFASRTLQSTHDV